MNKSNQFIALSLLTIVSIACSPANAGEKLTDLKQGLAFNGGAIAGLSLAGPVGMLVGALGGVYLGEQLEKADTLPGVEQSLYQVNLETDQLQSRIALLENELATEIAAQSDTRLEFQMLFRTGEDSLIEKDQARIEMLASYLKRNPTLMVRLDGYADPRGTEEYNNILAKYRALKVADELTARGIETNRIKVYSHGATASEATFGDYESYARERRVNIEVYQQPDSGLAQRH